MTTTHQNTEIGAVVGAGAETGITGTTEGVIGVEVAEVVEEAEVVIEVLAVLRHTRPVMVMACLHLLQATPPITLTTTPAEEEAEEVVGVDPVAGVRMGAEIIAAGIVIHQVKKRHLIST